jgi:hypothetical protein
MLSDDRLRTMLASVADEATPSPTFLDGLWDELARERSRPVVRGRTALLPLAATLAALLLLLLAVLALTGSQNPPSLGGVIGQIEIPTRAETTLVAGDGALVVGWQGHMGRVDTTTTSLPSLHLDYNDVAYGPAGWWVAGTDAIRRWAPSGSQGWSPGPGPVIDVLATDLAVGEREVVARTGPQELRVFDAATGRLLRVINATARHGLVVGGGAVWTFPGFDPIVFDIATGEQRRPPANVSPSSLAFGANALWLIDSNHRVQRIDPLTGRLIAIINVGFWPTFLAFDEQGYLWALGGPVISGDEYVPPAAEAFLARVDPATNRSQTSRVDLTPVGRTWENLADFAVMSDSAWLVISNTRAAGPFDLTSFSSIVRVAIDRAAN